MSDLQLVKDLYAAFDRGDLDAIRSYLAADFTMNEPAGLPWSGNYAGPDGFFEFFGKLLSHVDAKVEIERIFDAGGTIVQVGHTAGTIRSNNAPFRSREVHTVVVRDSKISRIQVYLEVDVLHAALHAPAS
ncbi:MAG: uncharacterized protein QOH03_933 [Kribbellaceae bacterium]|jgi:ketosteroid isomerase-like protein|nr:uncharacterized protein [Kribbellaceae bacterium]